MKLTDRLLLLLGIMLLAVLAACDAGPTATPTPLPTPPATPAPATPPPSPTAPASPTFVPGTPDPTAPVIVYEKSGGIAGIRDVLEIYADGTARWTPSRQPSVTFRLPSGTVANLRAQFATAHFFDFAAEYDNHNVADDFYYTITYTADGQTKQVTAAGVGGQDITPQALLDLITTLQQLAGQAANVTPSAVAFPPTAAAPTPPAPTVATTPPAGLTPGPAPTGNAGGPMEIVYGHSGGIAGLSEALEIGADGVAHLSSRGRVVGTTLLTSAQLDSLVAQFEQAQFFTLQDRYDSGNVADDIYNTITYSRNGQIKTITAAEVGGQGFTPQPLLDLIAALRRIADDIRAQPTPVPATPAPSPAVTGTTGSTEGSDLIVYRVQGGIAGLDTAMFIDRRGGVRFTSRGADTGTAQMSADDLRALIDLLNASNFFDLQDRYAPLAVPSDNETLTVTYNSGGRSKTVAVESGASEPPALTAVLVRLLALQTQLQPK